MQRVQLSTFSRIASAPARRPARPAFCSSSLGAVGHPSAAGYAIARPAGLGNTLRSYGYFALRAQYASAFVRALNRRARNAPGSIPRWRDRIASWIGGISGLPH